MARRVIDSDDEEPTFEESTSTGAPAATSFGSQYLAKLGHKEGQPLQAGGATTAYVPATTGGFASSNNKDIVHRTDAFKIGVAVVLESRGASASTQQLPTLGGPGTKPMGIISRCNQAEKICEVKFPGDRKTNILFQHLRLASEVETQLVEKAMAEGGPMRGKRGERDDEEPHRNGDPARDVTWIVPGLIVRSLAESSLGKKGVVTEVTSSTGGGNTTIVTLRLQDDVGTITKVNGQRVDTVIPKKGDRAMVIKGFLKGHFATILERVKDPESGDVTGVQVQVKLKEQDTILELRPDDLTALPV